MKQQKYNEGRKEKNQNGVFEHKNRSRKFHYASKFSLCSEISLCREISLHSENLLCSEFSSVVKFWHCSSLLATVPLLPAALIHTALFYSSCFDILHSRLAEIDRKPYEIDGNQPDFVMIGLTRRFGFQFLQKLQKQPWNAIRRIVWTLMCKSG